MAIKCMVILNMDSAIPRDAVVNTFYASMGATSPAEMDVWAAGLGAFYTSVSAHLSTDVSPTNARLKFYNTLDAPPRAPIYERNLSMGSTTGGTSLPHELAICVSFQGARLSGTPQSRRRGRIYLGPLNGAAAASSGQVASTAHLAIKNAAAALLLHSDTSPEYAWVVNSETSVPATTTLITNGWVDDAFDIQRRRGLSASSRLTYGTP